MEIRTGEFRLDLFIAKFLNDLASKPEKIFGEHKEDTVKLLTAHRSKGLEFETVYLAGTQPEDLFVFQSRHPG